MSVKPLAKVVLRRERSMLLAAFLCLFGLCLGEAVAGQLPVCSWPFQVTGQGLINVATPDTNSTYWVMPLDTHRWPTMLIHGEYPEARYFSIVTYNANGSLADDISDAGLRADAGSTNPFADPTATEPHAYPVHYTLTIDGAHASSVNHIRFGPSRLAFIVYRLVVPDQGVNRKGGVPLPAVTVVGPGGEQRPLQPCPFASTDSSLARLILSLRAADFDEAADFLQNVFNRAAARLFGGTGSCEAASSSVTFEKSGEPGGFFPNPDTTYVEASNLCLPAGKVLVVRGQAPVFPGTYENDKSVLQPATGPWSSDPTRQVQVRYFSLCNYDDNLLGPAIACQPDWATHIESVKNQFFYTFLISADTAPPHRVSDNPAATWLPWGATDLPKRLIFRVIPTDFPLPEDYYHPQAVFCDAETVRDQGWEACFQ